jgi:hypothetical protein
MIYWATAERKIGEKRRRDRRFGQVWTVRNTSFVNLGVDIIAPVFAVVPRGTIPESIKFKSSRVST